ncbi:receptor-like protein 12 [Dorcoceras hygrometricum]|uniref:Receptor-like protein 12 n=1 Tax=Dorcoceras hygrometricum TaxID=472368 RepID=A0A2Z7BW98_9LAMI|nr:receptor-like protein 12 [Dorcoceras hygrometricum]
MAPERGICFAGVTRCDLCARKSAMVSCPESFICQCWSTVLIDEFSNFLSSSPITLDCYCSFKPYFRRLPSFSPLFGEILVALSSSSLGLSIDTSLETGVVGFEECEVVPVFVCLRDCGPVVLLFFNSFGLVVRVEISRCVSVFALRIKTTAFRLVGATSFGCCVWYQLVDFVCVSAGCSADVDVNAGQLSCSSKMMRRRFVVATGNPAASEFRRYCLLLSRNAKLLQFECCVVLVELRSGFRLLPESSGFLAGLVVAQFKDVRASGNTALSSPCLDRSHHAPSGYIPQFMGGATAAMFESLSSLVGRASVFFGVSCIAPAFYSLLFISVVLLLSVLEFNPMSLRGLVCFFVALFSGNPGSTAGRGFNPAGGAPGGG